MANASQVVVGANGKVWVADIGTSAPTDATSALAAGWTDLGYVSEDGATFSEGKDITDIGAWQSFYPIRYIINSRQVTLSFTLRQWNNVTVEFALGGTITGGPSAFTYTPPSPETLDLRQMALEWTDGAKSYRLYVRRGLVSETVETQLIRTDAANLPITFSAMDPGSGTAVYSLFTNDTNFALSS